MMTQLLFLLLVFLSKAKANLEMDVTGELDVDDTQFEMDVTGELEFDNSQFEMDISGEFDFEAEGLTSSCASMTDCGACTKTYTCHWCGFDNSCHAKGSRKGCSWGATCSAPKPQGCAAHKTCSDCALASHTCHWCEFDNACHLIGSPHGCASGVDCYSNEKCRRKEPKEYEGIITEMPTGYVALVMFVSFVLILSVWQCLSLLGRVCGGYQEVDVDTSAPASASVSPSIIGISLTQMAETDSSYTAVATDPPEESQMEEGENNGPVQQTDDEGMGDQDQSTINEGTDDPVHSDYVEMADTGADNAEPNETAFLLDPPVLLVLLIAFLSVFFFPVMPTFSVCNDSIGWKRVIEHIIAMRIDASFEVLISLSNKNRIAVALDQGSGTFQFDGRPLGTFVIPPVIVESTAISDLMIVAKASPDRHQALKIVQAFRSGHLILDADFDATIRLPWFFNYTRNITVEHYLVDVTAPKDRTLCQCPTWDDSKNATSGFLLDLIPDIDEMTSDLTFEIDS
ncbi:MAG: hypothetical protein SGBAC_003826 [Bacillariaceae sp.]